MPDTRDTVDIETAGESLTINLSRATHLGIYVRGDAAADYVLDVSDEDGNWITEVETFSGVTEINYRGEEPALWARIRVTTGTATAGDQADLLLTASE